MVGFPDPQDRRDRQVEFFAQPLEECPLRFTAELRYIRVRDLEVCLRADHLDLCEKVVEEWPRSRHRLQQLEPIRLVRELGQSGTDAEPAWKHDSRLRPAESPRNRANALNARLRSRTIRGTRAEAHVGQRF